MTDTDQEWRPKNRPQSTVAQNFSAALDELFQINGGIDAMASKVDQKKHTVDTQSRELEALERRLKETEARLKRASSQSPRRGLQGRRTSGKAPTVNDVGSRDELPSAAAAAPRPLGSLPQMQQPQPGAPTQAGASEGAETRTPTDYVMVDRPAHEAESKPQPQQTAATAGADQTPGLAL